MDRLRGGHDWWDLKPIHTICRTGKAHRLPGAGSFTCAFLIGCIVAGSAFAQVELTPWGNLRGIRTDGQLTAFTTSLCLVGPTMADITASAHEKQRPAYKRDGDKQIVMTGLSHFSFVETVKDAGQSTATVDIGVKAAAETTLTGVFLRIEFPGDEYSGARIALIDSSAATIPPVALFPPGPGGLPGPRSARNFLNQASVKGFRIVSAARTVEVTTERPTEIIVQKGNPRFGYPNDRIFLGILTGHTSDGDSARRSFRIKASGTIDRSPVRLSIDPAKPGRRFDGIGGNFRLQNEQFDPRVIQYCLDNLNVRWARVEMPWRSWHPVERIDPLAAAEKGKLDEGVRAAMEMAQTLARRHIPLIVSAWYPPPWAIVGEPNVTRENGLFGNPLDPKKMRSIVKSMTGYFVYLKVAFGVEPEMFSFNESDLGINVRMTGEEQAAFIKKLGASFASADITTKMLLGDNSDATTIDFIEPALEDPGTHQYIGALSFHAWRGCDDWTLANWADASRELNVPLLIAEGGTDAQAYTYPDVFREPWFAQEEIDVFVRACNVAHVRSILQWQLTSDYSLLTGEGIYGSEGPLHPTQRFWNLKQLGMVPSGSFILPATCDNDAVSCAAFADLVDGTYTIDIVNHGASRQVVLSGLPEHIRELRTYVTDAKRGMEEGKRVRVSDGKATFALEPFGFTTLTAGK